MIKVLFLAFMLSLSFNAFAQDGSTSSAPASNTNDKLVDMKYPDSRSGSLVNMNASNSRIYQMDKRIDDLEREIRYLRDSLRDLERTVRDLRRRTG